MEDSSGFLGSFSAFLLSSLCTSALRYNHARLWFGYGFKLGLHITVFLLYRRAHPRLGKPKRVTHTRMRGVVQRPHPAACARSPHVHVVGVRQSGQALRADIMPLRWVP